MPVQTIFGTPGWDILDLSSLPDPAEIFGLGGKDFIIGTAFDDVIDGGASRDKLLGGDGDDVFLVTGTSGDVDAYVSGGAGYDVIQGSSGDDVIAMSWYAGAETVEEIIGGGGFDVFRGDDGYNTLNFSGTTLTGIARIEGLGGRDGITGSVGDDVIVGGAGNDRINGYHGFDTAVFSGLKADYDVTVAAAVTVADLNPSDGNDGTDTLTNIERLQFADGETVLVPSSDNRAPVAVADAASTAEDTPVTVPVSVLLSNDSDADGDPLALTGLGSATGGTAVLDGNGGVLFTPAADFNGEATFEYLVSDGTTATTGAVTVAVSPVNDTPVAVSDLASTQAGVPVTILASHLLSNDGDVDGDALSLTGVGNAANGTATLNANGDVVFTPDAGFTGTATFDYTLSDGIDSASGAVSVAVGGLSAVPSFRILVTDQANGAVQQWSGLTGDYLGEFADGLAVPTALTVGPDGNVYVGASGNLRHDATIEAYAPDGTHLGQYTSLAGLASVDHDWITALVFGPDKELYVLDNAYNWGEAEIFRFDPLGSATEGQLTDLYIDSSDYLLPQRRIRAFDVEIGPDDNLYIPNPGMHEILRFQTPSGTPFGYFGETFITTAASVDEPLMPENWTGGSGDGWAFFDANGNDITGARAWGLAWDEDGILYVAADQIETQYTSMRIGRFTADGTYLDDFVPLSAGYDDGAKDLDFGPDGNLYVTNRDTGEILVFGDPDGPQAGQLINTLTVPQAAGYVGSTSIAFVLDDPSMAADDPMA